MAINMDDYELYQGMLFPKGTSQEDRDRYIAGQEHKQAYEQSVQRQIDEGGYTSVSGADKFEMSMQNVPSSGYKALAGFGQMIEHPIDTLDAIANVGGGALQLGLEKLGIPVEEYDRALFGEYGQNMGQKNKEFAEAMGSHFSRYGSVEGLQKAMVEDPVGVATDAASLLMLGGGATRMVGAKTGMPAVEKAGSVMSRVGTEIEPITATIRNTQRAGSLLKKGTGEAVTGILGLQTGTGQAPLKEAYASGVAGGERAESFRGAMRGQDDMTAILDDAQLAIDAIRDRAMTKYQADKAVVAKEIKPLSFDPIDKIIDAAKKDTMSGKLLKKPTDRKYIDQVEQAVGEWKAGDPMVNHTPIGFDDLKQRIMDIYETIPFENKSAQRAVLMVKKQIQKQIAKDAPTYNKWMSDYAKSMEELSEVRRSLSFGGKASAETKLKKLQSVMRNNVNTGYGSRLEAVNKLDQEGANIIPRVAGQALESWTPRGMQTATTIPTSVGLGSYIHPLVGMSQAAMSSPRLMGELTHLTGRMARPIEKMSEFAGKSAKALDEPQLMNLLYQMTRTQGDL